MHLVVTKVPVKPDSVATATEYFASSVPDVLGGHSGWRGAELSIDADGTFLVVGYWDDADQMMSVLASPAHAAMIEGMASHFAGEPDVSIRELASVVGSRA